MRCRNANPSDTHRGRRSLFGGLLASLAALTLAPPEAATANGIVVNSLADASPPAGVCTLRTAMENADSCGSTDCTAGSRADTITFSVAGTITLGSNLPFITDSAGLTIDGGGKRRRGQG